MELASDWILVEHGYGVLDFTYPHPDIARIIYVYEHFVRFTLAKKLNPRGRRCLEESCLVCLWGVGAYGLFVDVLVTLFRTFIWARFTKHNIWKVRDTARLRGWISPARRRLRLV